MRRPHGSTRTVRNGDLLPQPRWLRFVDRFGRKGQPIVEYLGGLARADRRRPIVGCFTRPFYATEVLRQMDELGVKSVSITGITALFTGHGARPPDGVLARGVRRKDVRRAASSRSRSSASSGPVLTALMVGGRVGSGITAELGSMTVTEQVDALRAMAISPVRRLVVPRVIAIVLMMPVLTAHRRRARDPRRPRRSRSLELRMTVAGLPHEHLAAALRSPTS